MKTANQSNTSNDKPRTVQDIICAIEEKSADGGYIFRGERKDHGKVSSSLWRECRKEIGSEKFDIESIQEQILEVTKDYTHETDPFEILAEIQHYGGKTNLIDFTTDYLIALFFACDGLFDNDGRVILQKRQKIKDIIEEPQIPQHRVIAQKSVFVRPPQGFIEPHEDDIVPIPAYLKQLILLHLEQLHGISNKTIYNDLHGFIRNKQRFCIQFCSAFTCSEKSDYDRAIDLYTNALESTPTHAISYLNRGNVYLGKGDFENAIVDYNTAIVSNPDYASAYFNRGNVYHRFRQYDIAIIDYNTAIELNPDFAKAYFNRGNIYYRKGEFDTAIVDYSKVIELNPDFDLGHYNRGKTWLHLQEWEKSKSDLITARDMGMDIRSKFCMNYWSAKHGSVVTFEQKYGIKFPDNIAEMLAPLEEVYYYRGIACSEKGDHDTASKNYSKAIDLKPNYAKAYFNLGLAYYKKGDYEDAIKDYSKAIDLNPNDAGSYHNRGEAWLHLQEWEKSKSDLMTARDMGEDIISAFRNDYESVVDFEQRHGVKLPADITAMLTPP